MATEQFSSYPWQDFYYQPQEPSHSILQRIEEKLGMIEQRLSKVEELLSKGYGDNSS